MNEAYIFICCNKRERTKACGNTNNPEYVYEYLRRAINRKRRYFKYHKFIKINKSGCLGRCIYGPNIVIFPEGVWYTYKSIKDIDEIIEKHFICGEIVERLLTTTAPGSAKPEGEYSVE